MAARITARSISSTARPGTTVNNLLSILGVTKQSLNRVLRTLVEDGLVDSRVGTRDKRERHLYLTEAGPTWSGSLSEAQRTRMRTAFRNAGPEAVAGLPRGAGTDDGCGYAPPLSRRRWGP
jgi:DNA-binding MarR family transcriptional regulator